MRTLVTKLSHCLQLPQQLRRLNKDERGEGPEKVMWIAVGVLILVAVVGLIAVFWTQISDAVNQLFPGGPKVKPKVI